MDDLKVQTLATALDISNEDALKLYNNGDYMVLTEEEASDMACKHIQESLWAFKPGFLIQYIDRPDDSEKAIIRSLTLLQGLLKDANPVIIALVYNNLEELMTDAINQNGIGHFLNPYDGKTIEQGEFLIFRQA